MGKREQTGKYDRGRTLHCEETHVARPQESSTERRIKAGLFPMTPQQKGEASVHSQVWILTMNLLILQ